jgi:F-type H+-transporting ATPase subunit delta
LSDTAIAMRYASALFDVVRDDAEGRTRARADLAALSAAVADPALAALVENPRVSPADQVAVLDKLAERAGAGDTARRLLGVLAAHGRAGLLAEVGEAYGRLADAAEGRERVTVTAAFALPDDLKASVESRLKALVGTGAEISHRVDAKAMGGLVVQIGSKVFDYSIRNHLAHMRQAI